MAADPIVIVGGGRAAASLIDAYREAGGDALITLVSEDEHPPYNRPPLSKVVLRGEMEPLEALVRPTEEYEDLLVDLRLGARVTSVDVDAHTVQLQAGGELRYRSLVIATGAQPRVLDVPGADLPAVHTFRTIDDVVATRADALEARKALVVGGSFIGSEVAASLRMLGLEVTIVELGERLVPALSSAELSDQVAGLFRENGVGVLLGEQIAEFTANGWALTGARTASGTAIEAFVAVVGVGVVPNVALLEGSGIEVDNGVLVDERFRTSAADVYAIGDVARYADTVAGRPRRIEHHTAAAAQGAHLGHLLAGRRAAYSEVPVFFTRIFDLGIQVLGDPDGGVDETVIHGSIADGSVLGFYLRDERLVGAVLIGQTQDTAEELKTMLRDQPRVTDRGKLANPALRPSAIFG